MERDPGLTTRQQQYPGRPGAGVTRQISVQQGGSDTHEPILFGSCPPVKDVGGFAFHRFLDNDAQLYRQQDTARLADTPPT
ncbi:hypothetical protein BJF84_15515 [Rhodococcus sp. CUA-806]|nr:hypothetical protein BJF84_26735 [Rhodococcus sp. CUA-806]OLT31952.1 hypothetical protein BJF84_25945 [Rhodococcus sp. CUA-806]OLT34970.1 hypothetical protein BJF84_15515 [Rhodococcus sp. CUA-806]